MYVHDEKKICFLASPRTGSRAWRDALLQVGFRAIGAHHNGPRQGFRTEPYFTFTVVRNHFDAILSWWYHLNGPDHESAPSLQWLTTTFIGNSYVEAGRFWQHTDHCTHIIRFERMNAAFAHLMLDTFEFGEVPPLLHVGKSDKRFNKSYVPYFNAETRAFIHWAWGEEMEQMQYTFGGS